MSVKFDRCPICGRLVGYEDSAGDNKDLYIAMCMNGHTVIDLGGNFEMAMTNEFQAARIWNKMVRKYLKEHNDDTEHGKLFDSETDSREI